MSLTPETPVKMPVVMLVSLIVAVISGVAGAYSVRSRDIAETRQAIEAAATVQRAVGREEMRRYLTREEFLEWRRTERSRQDQQFYSLLSAIERISSRIGRGGR